MRRQITLLFAIALALRSLVPVGFMLASTHGELTMVICSSRGPQTLPIDLAGTPVPHKSGHSDTELCAYATTGAVTLGDGAPAPLAVQVSYAAVAYRIGQDLFRVTPRPNGTSARGPPSLLI